MNARVAAAAVSPLLLLSACARNAPAESASAVVLIDSGAALPPGGGCHPIGLTATGTDQFPLINPEWAPVVNGASPLSRPVLLHGTVADSQVSREDFPSTHVTHDQNTGIHLDDADRGLLATGNAAEGGDLELEWETGSYPAWAWAGPGDRIVALGRWIFDCGHPDPAPGACGGVGGPACVLDSDCATGVTCQGTVFRYRSELHPPQATAVLRTPRGAALPDEPGDEPGEDGPVLNVSRADVYVSADGGGAGDACVVTAKPSFGALLGAPCFPLSAPLALLPSGAAPLNAVDFEVDVPLPLPRGRRPIVEVVPRDTPGVGRAVVPARLELVNVLDDPSPHVHAIVHMREPVAGAAPTGFAGTILAGWRDAPRRGFVHLRVTVDGVAVRDPLKPPPVVDGLPVPPGWVMEASVNGEWQQLAGLDGIDADSAGSTVPVHAVFEQWVPRGGTLTLGASGASRTCNDLLFGHTLLEDLGRFGGSLQLAFACLGDRKELDAGSVAATFTGPRFGARPAPYVVASQGGAAAYALSFRIERVDE
jgi:hypothetical protein